MDKYRVFKFILGCIFLGCISLLIIKATAYAEDAFESIIHFWKYSPLILTPCGFLLIAWLIHRFFNGAQGSGIPQTLRALTLPPSADCSPYLSLRILLGKLLIIPAYLCGGSLGYEGPAVQIGASIMLIFQKYVTLSKDKAYYAIIMSGAAAGLSSSLTAPLTGIVFVIEEFTRYYFNSKLFSYILVAVIISCFISDMAVGHYIFLSHSAIDSTDLRLNDYYGLLLILACGLIGGTLGSLFNHSLIYSIKRLSRVASEHPLFLAMTAGLFVGILDVVTNGYIAGCGAGAAKDIFLGQSLPISYAPLKMVATLLTYLSGVPTGLFTPSLGIGAMLSQILIPLFHAAVNPHIIIILMMASYMCGVLQAPLTVCTLIMEITGQDSLLLPIIATTLISNFVANSILKVPLYKSLSLLMYKVREI